ncbi:ClpXP protease specificity-enhancing factor [Ahniella affigens]|uniref:ClpXP protease specificity-enhancing factor n=1 Tax=Ahniella affigens TaxID=2021234 RepID=A0A2P1PTM3_9GAMM|nr:ClpXP protease specificity-enhancing factor [Ahniella affigens]AVP98195.1 ClpXP protease specificity-enhancing factor [Ahniella affigens]
MSKDALPPVTSNRPYLIRAIYDWIVDNGQTPLIIVDARAPGVIVPPQSVRDGIVVLNISMTATGELELGNDLIRFNARFSGVSRGVQVPVAAVMAIRSREYGLGMVFSPDLVNDDDSDAGDADATELSLGAAPTAFAAEPVTQAVAEESDPLPLPPAPSTDPDRPKRGHLRVVK